MSCTDQPTTWSWLVRPTNFPSWLVRATLDDLSQLVRWQIRPSDQHLWHRGSMTWRYQRPSVLHQPPLSLSVGHSLARPIHTADLASSRAGQRQPWLRLPPGGLHCCTLLARQTCPDQITALGHRSDRECCDDPRCRHLEVRPPAIIHYMITR